MRDARPRRMWRTVLVVLARGVLVVVGLCAVGVGITRLVALNQDVGAYARAPVCTTGNPRPGEACVRLESGRVTGRYVDRDGDSTTYNLTVARESAPGGDYGVGEAFYDDADAGTYVLLKVWEGEVAEIGYQGHKSVVSHPRAGLMALAGLLIAGGTGVLVLGLLGRGEGSWLVALLGLVPSFIAVWIGVLFFGHVHLSLAVAIVLGVGGWLALVGVAVLMSPAVV